MDDEFSRVGSIFAADVDGDGDNDIIGGSRNGNGAQDEDFAWWENTVGDGSNWTKHVVTVNFNGVRDVFAGDIDGDGDIDILGAGIHEDGIAWWENTSGDGSSWIGRFVDTNFEFANSVFAADIDSDGDLDVLGSGSFAENIPWWENTAGNGTVWTKHTLAEGLDGAGSAFAADVDGDGDSDILARILTLDHLVWWENTAGDGTAWNHHTIDENFSVTSVLATDMNGDGNTDILGAAFQTDEIAWWENTFGDGSAWSKNTVDDGFNGAESVFAADVDGDGDTDILGAAFQADDIAWWENQGGQYSMSTTPTAPVNWTTGQTDDVLEIVVTHNGRAGDNDVELESLSLLFEESPGVPLTTQDVELVIDGLSVYLDNGSGNFEAGADTLVTTISSLSLDVGVQTIAFTPGDPLVQVSHGTPNTYFVVARMQAVISPSALDMFDIAHVATASIAVESDSNCQLLPEDLGDDGMATIANIFIDCNTNGVADIDDISSGTSPDCNTNAIPDECEPDADGDGVPDGCDNCPGFDDGADTDGDGVADGCDICDGDDASGDADLDGVCDDLDACAGHDDNIDVDMDGVPDGCESCDSALSCMDDNVCSYNYCNSSVCDEFSIRYGDVAEPFGGVVQTSDILCAVDGFGNYSDCPNADIAGCAPSGVPIGTNDILAVVAAFGGEDPCGCSGTSAASGVAESQTTTITLTRGVGDAAVTLIPQSDTVSVGDIVSVDVFVSNAADTIGYEIRADAEIEGLILESVSVNESRSDYAFAGHDSVAALDQDLGRIAGVAIDQAAAELKEFYVGTIHYRISDIADGTLSITLDIDLFRNANELIDVAKISNATIEIVSADTIKSSFKH